MSGFQGADTTEGGIGFTTLGISNVGSDLTNLLLCEQIVPGTPPSYQVCKSIFTAHPLGGKMAETPVNMAQSQNRELTVPGCPESALLPAFECEWKSLGKIGAEQIIKQVTVLARVYGIASVGVGDRNRKPGEPLNLEKIADADLYFNVFDPLNTAGSLVLNQDPNSSDFMKPRQVSVAGVPWHPSRLCVMMNEQPIYIEWSSSAFGFVGRSVYQRALFPLKSFVQSMVTDQYVTIKCGLLIAKMKAPGNFVNNRIAQMFGFKRQTLQAGVTGNVLSVGENESIESLNFQNLEGAARFARENILKNIATAAGMPAKMLDQETLVSGFGEGAEDAKQIARYVDRMRIEMNPIYAFFDDIVMRRAWSPAFYEGLKQEFQEFKKIPYVTAFQQFKDSFNAIWPNLLVEPDSEKAKAADVQFKSAIATVEVLAPLLGPKNKANLARWVKSQIAERTELFSAELELDDEELDNPPPPEMMPGGAVENEREEPSSPPPFSARA